MLINEIKEKTMSTILSFYIAFYRYKRLFYRLSKAFYLIELLSYNYALLLCIKFKNMNEEFKNKIEDRWGRHRNQNPHGRVWAGLLILVIGVLLLLRTSDILFLPSWIFTWPMILIGFGVLSGIRHGFRGGAWIIMIFIGSLFLLDEMDSTLNLQRYIAPVAIIAVGLLFILRPKRNRFCRNRIYERNDWQQKTVVTPSPGFGNDADNTSNDRRDFIDVTAVFGSVKKNIMSKTFKGGDIVSFMGGSEINLNQADFTGKVTLDITNIFAGTKLIIPPTWDVQSDITAIFGGVDDKRQLAGVVMDPTKILILDGTCLFGGIEIKSY
jgi:predicted membrane protein